MKAVVLPHLGSNVRTVYLEATPAETELRILHGLGSGCWPCHRIWISSPPCNGSGNTATAKTLIVIDQFEQWLHTIDLDTRSELIRAFRQCDGASLQAVVMIRDDFAMAAARFMDGLEIPIIHGTNFATVDLFVAAGNAGGLNRYVGNISTSDT